MEEDNQVQNMGSIRLKANRWIQEIIGDGVKCQVLGADALWFSGAMLDTRLGLAWLGRILKRNKRILLDHKRRQRGDNDGLSH